MPFALQVDPEKWSADYIEINFQDQHLGRNEMWRLDTHLVGQCVYVDEEISFLGVISARVQSIYVDGKKVRLFVPHSSQGVYGCHSRYQLHMLRRVQKWYSVLYRPKSPFLSKFVASFGSLQEMGNVTTRRSSIRSCQPCLRSGENPGPRI